MKRNALIAQLRKTPENNAVSTNMRVGDIVTYNKADHLVVLLNDSRAALIPLSNLSAEPDSISPDSELPLVERLGVAAAIELCEKGHANKESGKPARATRTEPVAPKLGKLGGYLGHTVVSVIRKLGNLGWDFKTIRAALDRVGVAAADQTIRIQGKCGRDGQGSLADLSKADIALLSGKAPRVSKRKTAQDNATTETPATQAETPAPVAEPAPLAAAA